MLAAGEFFHGNCCWLEDGTTRPPAGSHVHVLRNALEKNFCLLFSRLSKDGQTGLMHGIHLWHLFCQTLASNTPLYLISVPTTRCQSVKQGSVLSYNGALSRESGAQSRSSFGQFSLGLGHKPWKFAVSFGVTGPESTFFSDTVSLIPLKNSSIYFFGNTPSN